MKEQAFNTLVFTLSIALLLVTVKCIELGMVLERTEENKAAIVQTNRQLATVVDMLRREMKAPADRRRQSVE